MSGESFAVELLVVMREPFQAIRIPRRVFTALATCPLLVALGLALAGTACGWGDHAEVEKISKPNLTEQDIRKFLATYRDLQDRKLKALRANAPDEYTEEQNKATMLKHGLTVNEFTFIGARIDNAIALLRRESTTPIPEVYKADCELVRRMRQEIDDVRKPIPYP